MQINNGKEMCNFLQNSGDLYCDASEAVILEEITEGNVGYCNTGYCNTGYCNTGYCNTGYWNIDIIQM